MIEHKEKNNLSNFPKEENRADSDEVKDNYSFFKSDINVNKQDTHNLNLKAIRTAKGLTQADLGRLCGFSSEFINMIEHNKHFPILETRIKIAKALGTDTSAIWIKEEER
jgi:DNA-binding XRE family transcriptional regulator|tara:strand:- start:301 stop:630 length:330 start_codon:yes stop_codon:yes gene_type:complete